MDRCSLCPGVNHCIPPDGPADADLMFIGEAPGYQEQHAKVPRVFIGKTGDEVNRHYLPLAGLRRDGVVFTNAIRCLPISSGGKLDASRAKDMALLQSCAERHLFPSIERRGHLPQLLIPLGAFACRAVCPDIDLELQHGIPVMTAWGIPAFPMYHPALGIHEPKKMLHIRTDWQRLKEYLHGTLQIAEDIYESPDYQEIHTCAELRELDPSLPLAGDTESTRNREPFCLTYSQRAGQARLIRASRHDLLRELGQILTQWRAPILFHNWLYDWPVTEAMGLRFPHKLMVDTMARVFHLGNLPQGLKALAYRELGMTMQDFDDVVTPYSSQNVLFYYELARSMDWPKPEEELVQDDKTGLWKLYKPQSMNTKLKRFFTDYGKNPEKDIFAMWTDNWVEQQAMIEAECGPWPGKCISHVPFDKVLYYACRDADALRRLWPRIQHMNARVRHVSQEHWRAA